MADTSKNVIFDWYYQKDEIPWWTGIQASVEAAEETRPWRRSTRASPRREEQSCSQVGWQRGNRPSVARWTRWWGWKRSRQDRDDRSSTALALRCRGWRRRRSATRGSRTSTSLARERKNSDDSPLTKINASDTFDQIAICFICWMLLLFFFLDAYASWLIRERITPSCQI